MGFRAGNPASAARTPLPESGVKSPRAEGHFFLENAQMGNKEMHIGSETGARHRSIRGAEH